MGCLTTNLRSGNESPLSERFEAALRSVRFTSKPVVTVLPIKLRMLAKRGLVGSLQS
jgi:hypothetical protein